MGKIDDRLFFIGISILLLCIFLTFIFFTPKKVFEKEDLVFVTSDKEEILNLTLSMMEEGDLILMRPKSISLGYEYDYLNKRQFNKFAHFIWYNLFDKIIITSMGDSYWHSGIYVGNKKMNSLYKKIYEESLNENFVEYQNFKVLGVKTSKENKKLAIKRANEHLLKQDVYFSVKNGLLIVYLESVNSKKVYSLKENEVVCSSYNALLYKEVLFDKKPPTHLTPVALEFSENTELKFLVNGTGMFVKK